MEDQELTAYELERQQRLEENKRRMQELGLPQMLKDMEGAGGEQQARKKRERRPAEEALEPTRRSCRNEGKVISYRYEEERGPGRPPRDGPLVKEGECEEVYGLAHVLALGSTEREWEMFTDGYDPESGERIYDAEKGASCHQCRQKTLGLRTSCSRCKSGLGMLCGDCLFARYGEHVEEVTAKPDWVCPCCRDLCNCSTHRKKRKWEATGQLHRSVKARGYLSVAHYLVLNKAGGLPAKRAALATGFCPPDLAAKLKADIAELEAAGAPEEEPEAAQEPTAPAVEGQQADKTAKKSRKSGASGGGAKKEGKKESKKEAGAAAGKGESKPKSKSKAPKATAEAKQVEVQGEGTAVPKKAKKAAAKQPAKVAAAATAAAPVSSPAAAVHEAVMEASGGSGAVAGTEEPALAEALASTAAAAKGGKAGGRKRAGLPGAGTLEEIVAAPARRRRSSAAAAQ